MPFIFFDGEFIPEETACVPIDDRGFLFGDGVFTTCKLSDGKVVFLNDHLDRLQNHCDRIGIIPPEIKMETLRKLITLNEAHQGSYKVKIVVSGGGDSFFRNLQSRDPGHVLITIKPLPSFKKIVTLALCPFPVVKPSATIKSLSYLDRLWIQDYAVQKKCDEAVSINTDGVILETAFSNIFWRVGDSVWTPDPTLPLLHGISIGKLMKGLQEKGLRVYYCQSKAHDIPSQAQLFIINSLQDIRPVTSFNESTFSRDFLFEDLLERVYDSLKEKQSVCFSKVSESKECLV